MVDCCRRFAAPRLGVIPFRGLTPTANCWHRFAIGCEAYAAAKFDDCAAIEDDCDLKCHLTIHPSLFELHSPMVKKASGTKTDKKKSVETLTHDEAKRTNRMILGDSLQVVASLAERDGLD